MELLGKILLNEDFINAFPKLNFIKKIRELANIDLLKEKTNKPAGYIIYKTLRYPPKSNPPTR